MKSITLLTILMTTALTSITPQNALAVAGWPDDSPGEERPEGVFSVSPEVVTPHTAWAKPYAGGTTKTLFIIPRWAGREVAELSQVMSLEFDVVMLGGHGLIASIKDNDPRLNYGAERPKDAIRRLTEKLAKDYRVIVLGSVDADALPEDAWNTLLAKVKAGTGLVVAGQPTDSPRLKKLLQEATAAEWPKDLLKCEFYRVLPKFKAEGATDDSVLPIRFYTCGSGNVIVADYVVGNGNQFLLPECTVTGSRQMKTAYDYGCSLGARLILAAARQVSPARIETVKVNASNINRTAGGKVLVSLAAEGKENAPGGQVVLRIREANELFVLEQKKAVKTAAVGFDIPANRLPAGSYFADSWLRAKEGAILDWASAAFEVTDEQVIMEVSVNGPFVRPDGTIAGQVLLNQRMGKQEELVLEVRDYFGRVTARETLRGERGPRVSFQLPARGVLSLVARVQASLNRDGQLVSRKQGLAPVRREAGGPGWDDFSFMVWAYDESFLRHWTYQDLAKRGMDRLMIGQGVKIEDYASTARTIADEYNCRPYPYLYHISNIAGCNPDPIRQRCQQAARALDPFGCDTYSLGDECSLCFGPYAQQKDHPLDNPAINASLRDYLQTAYRTLDELNREWNSAYQSWDQVSGIALEEARKNGQDARWVDHRLHRDAAFSGAIAAGLETVQATNKRNRCGFEGAFQTETWRGYDWAQLNQGMNLMGSYWSTPAEWEFMASFKQPGSYWGFWNGAYVDVSNRWTQRWIPWRCLLWGMNSIWYWQPYYEVTAKGSDIPFGVYTPDYRVNPAFEPFLEGLKEVKSGYAKLLLNAERVHAPIAIHYSQPSIHASTLDDGGFEAVGAGLPSRIQASWHTFAWSLKEVGLQPRFLSTTEIVNGGLRDYRVLILPFSQAMSARECAEIRKFVERGGILVADVRPAVRDEHGKLQAKGLLDDVFGIERAGDARPKKPGDISLRLTIGNRSIKDMMPYAQSDPTVRPSTGQALAHTGKTPIFIQNRVGQGTALLMNLAGNYSPGNYGKVVVEPARTTALGDAYLDLALAIADLGGVSPELTVDSGSHRLRGIDIVTWRNGASAYFGFTPNDYCDFAWVLTMPKSMPMEARGRESGFYYDMRPGAFLGEGDRFRARFARGSAVLIARLPYQVTAVEGEGADHVKRGETARITVQVRSEAGKVGDHVVRAEVTALGKPLDCYSANLLARNGRADYRIPIALNDPTGEWVIRLRDVATGTTAKFYLQVAAQ